jgi:hypothetical protein
MIIISFLTMNNKKDYLDGIRNLKKSNGFEDNTLLLMHNPIMNQKRLYRNFTMGAPYTPLTMHDPKMNKGRLHRDFTMGESYTPLTMHDPKFIKQNPFEQLEINPFIKPFYTEMAAHLKMYK